MIFIQVTIVDEENKEWTTLLNLDEIHSFKVEPETNKLIVEYKVEDSDDEGYPWNYLKEKANDISTKLNAKGVIIIK